jgi:predicted Zn-dependent peptidase
MSSRICSWARPLILGGLIASCGGIQSPYALRHAPPHHLDLPSDRYALENGLEIILAPDHTVPFVAVDLWYHVGSKDDPPGRDGLAHLFEHLLADAGSRHVGEGEHGALLAAAGARDVNAETARDQTSFHETVLPGNLELAIWLESDRMAFFEDRLTADKLERERHVVENELRQRMENQPYGMVPSYVWRATFPLPHPYSHLPIGSLDQLDRVTVEEARTFFRTWYVPRNATLALVGDFDPAFARALLGKYFGPIPPGAPLPQRPDVLASSLASEKRQTVEADVPRARVVVVWPVVPRFAPGSIELETGARPLAGHLRFELAEGAKLASSVHAWMHAGHLASAFEVSIELEPGVSPERVLGVLDERMHALRGIHARYNRAEFALSRAQLLTSPLYESESFLSRAEQLQLYNQEAGRPDYADTELALRQFVNVEDVRKAYYDLLQWDRRVVTFVTPQAGAPQSGRLRPPS